MNLHSRLTDFVTQEGKAAAKALYARPVLAAAGLWRNALANTCFIGVTGSAGKTTTKDLLYAALAGHARCTRSTDSNNQLYSIARTLLGTTMRAQFCVQEVGASEVGAFDPMLTLLKPTVGVVTNIGTDHMTSFRTRKGVAAEKGKLISCLPASGVAVLNADDDLVAAMASNCQARVVTYGLRQEAEFRGEVVADRWPGRLALRIHHGGEGVLAQTRLLGAHQAGNVLAAVATVCSLGVPLAQAALALAHYDPLLGRMSVHETRRGVTFIRDDWKAPEWSLANSLEFMVAAQAARKFLVLGTISDSGGKSGIYQRAVTAAIRTLDYVLLVGPRAGSANLRLNEADAAKLFSFATVQDASQWLGEFTQAGDLVLLKGSNSADHLARLALAMDRDVRCWKSRCGRTIFCDRCSLVSVAAAS